VVLPCLAQVSWDPSIVHSLGMNQHIPKDRTINLAPERPRELCEMILAALGRDDKLRWDFLRRRWQGLDDPHVSATHKLRSRH
jgi:hypothetical protein